MSLIHLEAGLPNALTNNWYFTSIMKGLKRHKGDSTKQKLPISVDILWGILSVLDLNQPFDISFWAACLVGFFTFFRKSNFLIPAPGKFDLDKHLCRSDVVLHSSGAVIGVRWSKTIQFKERVLHVPLPGIENSPFCPTGALLLALSHLPYANCPTPLFCYPSPDGPRPLTHDTFVTNLCQCLSKLGLNPALYSGHSLRRGGASFAMQCGVPSEWIKLQGDWASDAYQRYLSPAFSLKT